MLTMKFLIVFACVSAIMFGLFAAGVLWERLMRKLSRAKANYAYEKKKKELKERYDPKCRKN